MADKWKLALRRAGGVIGGLIKIYDAASRNSAETNALDAGNLDKGTDATLDYIEKIDPLEASYRGMATETTLAAMKTGMDLSVQDTLSVVNSRDAELTSNEEFQGAWEAVTNRPCILVNLFSDQASAALGLKVKWSIDGTDATQIGQQEFAISAGGGLGLVLPKLAPYVRIYYKNGGTATTAFKLETRYLARAVPMGSALNPQRIDPTGTTPQPVIGSKTLIHRSISLTTAGAFEIIPAPAAGLRAKIVYLELCNRSTSTDNTVQLLSGGGNLNGSGVLIPPKGVYQFNALAGFQNLPGAVASNVQAVLSAGTNVDGFVLYYVEA